MVQNPPSLVAGEPTGNLDGATGEQIMALLLEVIRERQMAMAVFTHAGAVASACGAVVRKQDGWLA